MSNPQVFYRKWRPQRFEDVSGQQHVTSTLQRAIAINRVAHAYLFTGPRGVGKTSTARILAKALNCTSPKDGEPDNSCANCIAVAEDRMLDLIEIDAASNRGIDDIRKLRENTAFSPVSGLWKVYIIDEVHMLTDAAFNALLKTLEEPPPRVVMVLATTDAHKLPLTIVSRCQRYDFRRLSNEDVVDRLAEVCGEEGIECEPEVLNMVARHAWGSLRDAENLLEQLAVSYGGLAGKTSDDTPHEITAANVRDLLGLGDTAAALELAAAIISGDAAKALSSVNREAGRGADLRALRDSVVDSLRAAVLIKTGVNDALSHPQEVIDAMGAAARATGMDRLLHALSSMGQADMKGDSSSPLQLELAVLKAVTAPQAAPPQATPASAAPAAAPYRPAPTPQRQPPSRGQSAPARAPTPAPAATRRPPPSEYEEHDDQPQSGRRPAVPANERWAAVTHALRRTKFRKYVLGTLLKAVDVGEPKDGTLTVRFTSKTLRENMLDEIQDSRSREAVDKAVSEAYGAPLKLVVAADDSSGTPQSGSGVATESPLVRAVLAMGARVVGEQPGPANK